MEHYLSLKDSDLVQKSFTLKDKKVSDINRIYINFNTPQELQQTEIKKRDKPSFLEHGSGLLQALSLVSVILLYPFHGALLP